MSELAESVTGYYSDLRTTTITHHKGFKRIVMVNKENKVIKDDITIYDNHKKKCPCGFTKSKLRVFNAEEIKRTSK